ncbi:hypothetical protein EAL2_808p01610 (plasmid) [Peptoclostridium acidaminophilum DSM 3953]|uniref:Uncharacterized protein n=1 Tax=Peptoclostridium acidaminophilum DSM 3953 TaxID=1286171 RepID=W8UA40_PEPAC|nr:hypothetical protein [Peptoclostridium acidaminophilum]AHM57666.1 hypothetical protein EAL2_808p01610 [Peptoclostridium acidaminophilum DSM 3953]
MTTTMQIADLITASGQTGPQMTHALKVLGNGDMQQGLIRIANYFQAEGKSYIKVGRLQGVVVGAAGAGLIFLIAKLIKDGREKSKQQEEAKAIMDAFKDNLPPEVRQEPKSHEESVLPNNNIQHVTEA